MALAMRAARRGETGRNPRDLETLVVALVRRGKVLSLGEEAAMVIETGDMLVHIRPEADPAPR
jgi:voltage-gated potassium channel